MAINCFHLIIQLVNGPYSLNAGVAYQHVKGTELPGYLVDALVHLLLVSHVHAHPECKTAGFVQLLRCGVGPIEVQIRNRNLGPFTEEFASDFLADAAGGSGD